MPVAEPCPSTTIARVGVAASYQAIAARPTGVSTYSCLNGCLAVEFRLWW